MINDVFIIKKTKNVLPLKNISKNTNKKQRNNYVESFFH